jgi:GNAT superfamily N-acetyltransferase
MRGRWRIGSPRLENRRTVPQADGAGMPMTEAAITVVPANTVSCEDLAVVFGNRGYASYCQCQKFRFRGWDDRRSTTVVERMTRLRAQTHCGDPGASTTRGLVAYLDDEPVGWCSVAPRTDFVRLLRTPVTFKGRNEDPADEGVWSIVCFVTRAGFRHRGVSRALARATVDFARSRGARALEGYPMLTEPGENVTWGELNVGSRSIFADAGFSQVSHPTLKRVVMRIDF